MRKLVAMAGVAGLALFAGSNAEAALLSIIGGTVQVIPAPGVGSLGNNVVGKPNNILDIGDDILDGSLLQVNNANTTLKYFFTGSEAVFLNTLVTPTPGGSQGNQPNEVLDLPGTLFSTVVQPVAGYAEFSFTVDKDKDGTVDSQTVNSPDGPDTNLNRICCSFALAYLDKDYKITPTETNRVGIFLDDSGQNNDNDHDDWVGYVEATSVTPVPLPASVPLFLAGLAGLGLIGRRRKQA